MIYRPDSFVLTIRHCVKLKAIRYESTSLNRIAADESPHVIVAYPSSALSAHAYKMVITTYVYE